MKKYTLLLFASLLTAPAFHAAAQSNPYCAGLNNPINFGLYTNPSTGRYSGKIGTKQKATSTWNNLTMTFNNNYSAGQLADQSSGSSCNGTSLPYHMKNFVINGAGFDPLTSNNLPFLPDSSFSHSIRIGNGCGGTEAVQLCYDFNVTADNALVKIHFAMSLENALHSASEHANPEFCIRVLKQNSSGVYVPISDTLSYITQSPNSNAEVGPTQIFRNGGNTGGAGNVYKPWSLVVVNLINYVYQNVRIEVSTGDCGYVAHYGYGYLAGNCEPVKLTASGCASGASDTIAVISAPSSLKSYQWYMHNTGVTTPGDLDLNNYTIMTGDTNKDLYLRSADFVRTNTGGTSDTLGQRTFLCRMVSFMNPQYPVVTMLTTTVGNLKPTLYVDSTFSCDGTVSLTDRSIVLFNAGNDSNNVDTSSTRWKFYSTSEPTDASLLDSITGGTGSYRFDTPGPHSVVVRTRSYNVNKPCWNEKTIHIRSLLAPTPQITFENMPAGHTAYCLGDTVSILDMSMNPCNEIQRTSYRIYAIHKANGVIDTVEKTGPAIGNARYRFICDTTHTRVEMWTRTNDFTMRDTNNDGTDDRVYCYAYLDTVVPAEKYPTLTVLGDTIVCNGNNSEVSVLSDVQGCSFTWYRQMNGASPISTVANYSEPNVTSPKKYYVKATSPRAGCVTWDSIDIQLVKPTLDAPITEMCTDEQVTLYAGGASSYTWTAMPDDLSLAGQEDKDTISVSPRQTTTYTLVGHGSNGCNANPLSIQVKVFPYPVPAFTLTPGFIDSEKPTVQFNDQSAFGVTTLWNFGNGITSTQRTVSHTFSDISQDSLLVSLTSGNELGCKSDTSFYLQVDLFAVWFPNTITPTLNSNKEFRVFTQNKLQFYSLYIYDRRGQLVFHSTDQNEAWDGFYKGLLCSQGAYVYVCNYRRDGTYEITTRKGTFLLLQ
ncbi:MAG: gliding motility-associated C-terminal domain-containing protein [Bacteroidales bacterium]|nr:gliding motility-associated C-terminal domain-containing protein [Bacteroidales bacterium]